VIVLTGVPNYPEGCIFKEFVENRSRFSNFQGIEVIRVPLVPRGRSTLELVMNYISFAVFACCLGPWKLRGRSFDVVFTCQLSPVTVGFPGALIARIKRVPMVMWVLDIWPDSLRAVGVVRSGKILSCLEKVVRFIYLRCDLILAQSHSFIPKIQELAGRNSQIKYFPSWAETVFGNPTDRCAPEVRVRDGVFNIMFAGNIGDAQDFACILAAAELLKEFSNIQWLIVGDGRMLNWVKSQIDSRGLTHSVKLLGRYPLNRMPEFFNHAHAMLVTLKADEIFSMTIPGKLQSYLAVGIPILAALNGEGADVVRRANAGLTCPGGDYIGLAAIALKMSKLSAAERSAMGKNGIAFSEKEFNRAKLIDSLEFFLNSICQ